MGSGSENDWAPPNPSVLDRLPHRPPFRFISCVTSLQEGREAAGDWSVTGDEWFFTGHFPGDPLVPGVLIIEALAQLSGLVGPHREPGDSPGTGRKGRLVHADVRFDQSVVPPARLVLRSTFSRSMQSLRQFQVSAIANGETVARGSLVLAEVG